jgi:drug/metabolite transporter (DMT)-like permease
MTQLRGRLLIVAAAVMWSTSGFFAKSPLFDGWDGATLAFWRAIFASCVLLPLVRRVSWNWQMIPMTLIFAAMNVTFLNAMVTTTAANAIWLQHTAPAWVFLFAVVWLKERVTWPDWRLLIFIVLGVGTILCGENLPGTATDTSPMGVIYGVVAGLTYAGVVISLRWLRAEDAAWLVALNHIVTAAVLAPYILTRPSLPAGEQWFYLIGLGVFQMGLPYLLFARGLRSIAGHEATGIVLLEPLLVPVWAWLAWQEIPAWWTFVGGGLILAGLVWRYLGRAG